MKTKCNSHCRSCGCHFTGLTAFDKHRTGPHDDRRCLDPDEAGLSPIKGVCDLTDDRLRKATVWTARTLDS